MPRKLVVEIVGDSKSYERALGRSAQATNNFGAAMGAVNPRVGKLQSTMGATGFSALGLAGAAGGLAVVLGGKSVKAASDLNEEIAKSGEVFGASAKEIQNWAETTARSIGISETEALRATGTFGALFKTLNVGNAENAKLSRSLVQLAADMSSFNNADPSDVLLALRSGLTGETEPLRRFGVFLSEARTQQVALNQTGKESIKQLTNQEKVLARYSIILKDTASAQGDVARTSDSFANQQRQLSAQVADLEAKLGAVLLPTLTNLITTLNDIIGPATDVFNALGKLRDFGPIDIPINIAVKLSFAGKGTGGIRDLLNKVKQETADAVEAGLTAGFGPIKNLEDLFAGKGPAGWTFFPSPVDTGGPLPGGGKTDKGKTPAQQAAADAKAAQEAIDRATRRANVSLSQQIDESAKRINHLKDLIREDPTNAKLQRRLTAEITKQNALIAQQVALNKSNADAARAAAAAAHDAAVQAAEDRRQAERDAADRKREQVKRSQFKALGLTPEGLKPTPGAGSLLQRATSLQEQIKGTALDKGKAGTELKKIVAFLKKNFNKAGKDVREAILGMLNDISGAFKDGAKSDVTGPLTKTTSLNTRKLAEGLGLTPEQERELRQRASKFNSAGKALGGNKTNAPGAGRRDDPRGGGPFVVESRITVNLDGQKIANVVTRNQQKDKRRNPRQKRGPHR